MCVGSCVGFTGPFSDLEACPKCGEHCYDQAKFEATGHLIKEPHKVFTTFPVGPQLQARWRDAKTADGVETELEAPESSNRITGHAPSGAGTRSGVTIVL